ncbi:uncharacterized protein A4U43_C07F19730 [Asparagus officinalis]|uniref:Knottin scorpion toxin-like domain-containing protein n=1 Tax=Asparagus officinalis TaxID=4686 RepID=A0A5P1ED98_ASPOF|nr:uncharacterized protein A4U43_C07F19730 [Asparagus officinalis]
MAASSFFKSILVAFLLTVIVSSSQAIRTQAGNEQALCTHMGSCTFEVCNAGCIKYSHAIRGYCDYTDPHYGDVDLCCCKF